jgi:hypothetical protein
MTITLIYWSPTLSAFGEYEPQIQQRNTAKTRQHPANTEDRTARIGYGPARVLGLFAGKAFTLK